MAGTCAPRYWYRSHLRTGTAHRPRTPMVRQEVKAARRHTTWRHLLTMDADDVVEFGRSRNHGVARSRVERMKSSWFLVSERLGAPPSDQGRRESGPHGFRSAIL